jgi:hypothetical protein
VRVYIVYRCRRVCLFDVVSAACRHQLFRRRSMIVAPGTMRVGFASQGVSPICSKASFDRSWYFVAQQRGGGLRCGCARPAVAFWYMICSGLWRPETESFFWLFFGPTQTEIDGVFKLALRGCERCPYLRMRCCYHAMLLPEAKRRCSAQFLEVLFSSIHVSRNLHCLFRCQGVLCKPWQTPRYLLPSLLWIRPIPHPAKATRAPLLWPPELGRCLPGTPALLAQARRRRALEVKQEQNDLPA